MLQSFFHEREKCPIRKLIIIFATSEIILNFNAFPKHLYTLYLNNNIQGLCKVYLFLTSTLNFENVQRSQKVSRPQVIKNTVFLDKLTNQGEENICVKRYYCKCQL